MKLFFVLFVFVFALIGFMYLLRDGYRIFRCRRYPAPKGDLILDADIRDLPETLRARREARPVPETDLEEDEEEEAPPAEAAPVPEDTTITEEAPEPERVPAAVRKKPVVKKGAYVPKH